MMVQCALLFFAVTAVLAGSTGYAHADLDNVRSYVAKSPSHVATDSLGRIITLDIIGNTVSIITPSTGTTQLIDLGFVPSTLAVGGTGPSERIYVGERNDDRIAVYNLDGTPDGHIQFPGSNLTLYPQEHAVNSDGTSFIFLDNFAFIDVYGSDRRIDSTISDYAHNGNNLPVRTNILAAAPNGDFVMTSLRNDHVVVFSDDVQKGDFVTKLVISETSPGTALDEPMALAVKPDGLIFMHDRNGIHVFNPDGTYVKTHQSPPINPIVYMDFLGHNLLISDNKNDRVHCYAVDGVDDGFCPSPPRLEEERRYPVGVQTQQLAVDSGGIILTLDMTAGNEQLTVTNRTSFNTQSLGLGFVPTSLATDPDGKIYVGDSATNRIIIYDSDLIANNILGLDTNYRSHEHAVSSDGTSFVLTQHLTNRLYAYSGDGKELAVTSAYDDPPGNANFLSGSHLAISPDATFAVVASVLHDIVIVYEYDPAVNPAFTTKFVISEASPGTALVNPRTPAVSPDGQIFVRDDNGIHVFSSEDGSYVKFYADPLSDSSDMAFLGQNLLLTHIPSGGQSSVVSYSVDGVDDEGYKSSAGQQGSASKDYMHTPTFGLSMIDYSKIVSCGYSMDGVCRDVLDYHVDYKRAEIATNSAHDFTLKSYAPMGLRQFQIVFGLPSIGTPLSEGEATISINLARDYSVDSTYIIESISYQNENNVINQDATISISEAQCRDSDVEMSCTEVAINDVLFREQMYHEPFAITATDTHGRTITHYLNEGLLVKGESLNEAPVSHGGILKKGNQHDAIPIELVRIDKLNDLWEDQWGNIWTKNDYSTWKKLTIEEFERNDDNTWSVMTRINSNFYKMIESEANKATLIWDGKSIQNDVGESFSFAPLDHSESRLEKLADQIGIEQDRAQKIMDKLIQRSMPIISENVDSMPQQSATLSHSEGMLKVVGRVAITLDTDLELTYGNPDRFMTVQIPVNDDGTFEYSVLMDKAPTVSLHYNKALLAWMS